MEEMRPKAQLSRGYATPLVSLLLLTLLLLTMLSSVSLDGRVGVVITRNDHGVTLGDMSSAHLVIVVDGGVVVRGSSALSVLPHSDGAVVGRSDKDGVESVQVVALGVLVGLDVDGLDSSSVALGRHVEQIHLGGVLVVDLVADIPLKERGGGDDVDAREEGEDAELHVVG